MFRSILRRSLLPLLCGLFVVLALWPALRAGPLLSSRYDWRYFESMAEVSRRTVVFFGQAPLWNPFSCGGEVDLANPQSLDGAPTFLFTLLFGTAWGFKLAMALYYGLALTGMYKLGRRLELSREAAALSAVTFGLSGYLAAHLGAGHINFGSVGLFPLLIYCFDRALDEWEWSVPAGAVAAWVAVFGGTFTPALAGELLCLWGLGAVLWPRAREKGRKAPSHSFAELPVWRRLLRVLGLFLLCGGAALVLGAYRMLPALEFITDHPRPLFRRTPDVTVAWRLLGDLLAWRELGPLTGRKYWSHEYTARLPLVAAPLVLFGLWRAASKAADRRLLLMLALPGFLAALLCMGNFSPLAPWSILQKLPVLRDLRVPSRHLVLLVFFVALVAGLGLDLLLQGLREKKPRAAAILGPILVVVAALDAAAFTQVQFRDVFTVRLVIPPSPPPFYHVEGHWSQMRELIFAGHGVMRCDEEAPLQRAESLDVGDPAGPQVRLSDPAAGEILEHRFTPNVRTVTLDLAREGALLLLNSNWNEHFVVRSPRAGVRVVAEKGRLAVDLRGLAPGRHTIEVAYAPRSFTVGVWLSLIGAPLLFAGFFAMRRRARRYDSDATRQTGAQSGPLGASSV